MIRNERDRLPRRPCSVGIEVPSVVGGQQRGVVQSGPDDEIRDTSDKISEFPRMIEDRGAEALIPEHRADHVHRPPKRHTGERIPIRLERVHRTVSVVHQRPIPRVPGHIVPVELVPTSEARLRPARPGTHQKPTAHQPLAHDPGAHHADQIIVHQAVHIEGALHALPQRLYVEGLRLQVVWVRGVGQTRGSGNAEEGPGPVAVRPVDPMALHHGTHPGIFQIADHRPPPNTDALIERTFPLFSSPTSGASGSFGMETVLVGAMLCDCSPLGRHTGLPLQEWLYSRHMPHPFPPYP